MKFNAIVTGVAFAALVSSAGRAHATQWVFQLTEDGCSAHCLAPGVSSLGNIYVNDAGGRLTFDVALQNALFNANGNGEHHALVFDLKDAGLTISDLSQGFSTPTITIKGKHGAPDQVVPDPGPFDAPPFGKNAWDYAIDYTGGAKQGSTPSALHFVVSDLANDLSLSQLVSPVVAADGFRIWAAADVYANRTTGNVGAIPEPATWAMMLLGVAGLGGVLRARRGTDRTREDLQNAAI